MNVFLYHALNLGGLLFVAWVLACSILEVNII
jgi:hypothetical protein